MATAKDGEFSRPPTPNQKMTSTNHIEKTPVSSQSSAIGPTPNSRKKGFAPRYANKLGKQKLYTCNPLSLQYRSDVECISLVGQICSVARTLFPHLDRLHSLFPSLLNLLSNFMSPTDALVSPCTQRLMSKRQTKGM